VPSPAPTGDAPPAPSPAPTGDAPPAPSPAPPGDAPPAPSPVPTGDAPPAPSPAQTRTRFSVSLQLGRAYASLIALIRSNDQRDHHAARVHADRIASIILGGARDRSRDAHPRPLRHTQHSTKPLTSPRPARKAYIRKGRKDQGDEPAPRPQRDGHRRSKALNKKPRRARNSSRKKAKGTG
jgi:hypothetical protein